MDMTELNLAELDRAQAEISATAKAMDSVLPLHQHLLFRFCTLSSRLRAIALRDVLSDHDIDMRDWLVLAALVELGPGTQRKIVKYTRLDKVAVSRATSRLKERDMITASPNFQDGRSHVLELTSAGLELFACCTQPLAEMEARILHNLDAGEYGSFSFLLSQVEQAVDEIECPGKAFRATE